MSLTASVVAYGMSSPAGIGAKFVWDFMCGAACGFSKQNIFESKKYGGRLFGVCAKISKASSRRPRCEGILIDAIDDALKDFNFAGLNPRRMGVFVGTSIGNVLETENTLLKKIKDGANFDGNLSALARYECSSLSEIAARHIGAAGVRFAVSTACSSSGVALATACSAVEQGELDFALVCGVDALSRITVNGFGSLQLLSQSECKPFDADRDGITLGEAAAVVAIMPLGCAEKAGMKIFAEIPACFCTADAYHPTAPQPDAEGVVRAAARAFERAKISAKQIDCYAAHGTGTQANDESEGRALKKIFGEECQVPFFSAKGKFGHTLGASALVNVVVALEALKRNVLPQSFGFGKTDAKIGLAPNSISRNLKIENVLSASLGFGGNNACTLISTRRGENGIAPIPKSGFYLSGSGAVYNSLSGAENVFEKEPSKSFCDISELLKDIPALKKRRWAKLQQMALSAARQACHADLQKRGGERVGVCFGTGLGMSEQTQKFIENALEKDEAEPLPTAFTNSVHNAITSAIAMNLGCKAFNSAVSAKELSFECAMWQAYCALNSKAADAFVVGACDEYNPYAESFMRANAKFSKNNFPMTEIAAAYFATAERLPSSFARVHFLKIESAERSADAQARRIKALLEKYSVNAEAVKKFIVPFSYNKCQREFIVRTAQNAGFKDAVFLEEKFGLNYSLSSFAPLAAMRAGSGFYLCYSKGSCGQCAIWLIEIL